MSNPAPGFAARSDKRMTIAPYGDTVTVKLGDAVIASSQHALELREDDYPPVLYIPFEDIYFTHLEKTATRTYCPFKGDATYWRATAQGETSRDAMWAYETPYDEAAAIRNHGAFYPDRVTIDAG